MAAGLFALVSCGGSSGDSKPADPEPKPPVVKKLPINLSVGFTKVTENSFDNGDNVGLYLVNYNGAQPGTLQSTGNYVSNTKFTYNNGKFSPSTELYWKDESTHADFYLYYPFSSVTDVNAHRINLSADQSIESNFKSCDFLWGKRSDVAPTSAPVDIAVSHLMSSAVLTLIPGTGFTEQSLASSEITVKINGAVMGADIDLSNGNVTAVGEPQSVVLLRNNIKFSGILVPQVVSSRNSITVKVDDIEYSMDKIIEFKSGTRHSIDVTLERISNGINVTITGWKEEGDDGGVAQ